MRDVWCSQQRSLVKSCVYNLWCGAHLCTFPHAEVSKLNIRMFVSNQGLRCHNGMCNSCDDFRNGALLVQSVVNGIIV